MLETLHIRNLAVVADLEVEFGAGLNAVTGETGAGKSLIIGALQLLLGERASPAMIRRDAAQADIAAVLRPGAGSGPFTTELAAFLETNGIASGEDGELLLRRVIAPAGSRNYINAAPVTLQLLRQLGELLIDIHGPHDHQSLLQPRCQLALLDSYGKLEPAVAECATRQNQAEEIRTALTRLSQEHLSPQEAEFLQFQLTEIEQAAVVPGEEDELNARHARAAHRRRLLEIAAACQQGLTEGESPVTEQLHPLLRFLNELAEIDPGRGAEFVRRLEEPITALQNLSLDLESYAESLDLEETELEQLESRIGLLQKLKRKYGPTLTEVLAAAATFRERLAGAEKRTERLAELTTSLQAAEKRLIETCGKLSAARQKAAGRLAKEITGKLQKLGFAQGLFEVRLTGTAPGPRGADQVEFCFAPNPGENLLPLRQIASSGEIARVMLAIKTILSAADPVPLLIFDEVDANIGGRVAGTVAAELAAIARNHQVLCITHLPQIAAAADRHYCVSKEVRDGRTLTQMTLLSPAEREMEIIRMLGSDDDSNAARRHAREMLARGVSRTSS